MHPNSRDENYVDVECLGNFNSIVYCELNYREGHRQTYRVKKLENVYQVHKSKLEKE